MIRRLISVLVILGVIISAGVFEEIFIHNTIDRLNFYTSLLETSITENRDDINVVAVKQNYQNLKKFWEDTETKLCFIVNFEKIRSVDESVIKLEDSIKNNDYSVTCENLSVIKNHVKILHYVVGANFNNII